MSKPFQISSQQFLQRYQIKHKLIDRFKRQYTICYDTINNCRVIVKYYEVDEKEKQLVVYQNLLNFEKLRQIDGICKLVSYCHNQNQTIFAAFEYNDITLNQFLKSEQLKYSRVQLYFFLLQKLLNVVENALQCGLQLDDITKDNILLEKVQNKWKLKIFYDENQKYYDDISLYIEKLFWSPEKIQAQIFYNQDHISQNGCESVYQIGIMLLDVMYAVQVQSKQGSILELSIDNTQTKYVTSGWYIIEEDCVVLNNQIINHKLKYLQQTNQLYFKELSDCLARMITCVSDRAQLNQLISYLRIIIKNKNNKNAFNSVQSETFSFNLPHTPRDSLKYSDSLKQISSVYAQTSPTKFGTSHNSIPYSSLNQNNQLFNTPDIKTQKYIENKIIIPQKEIISKSNNVNERILSLLKLMIQQLHKISTIIKKVYYDTSTYYGEINKLTGKRSGKGIYICSQNNIYFGTWQENLLIEGTYIFQNGESYEGKTNHGKQGWGRYIYNKGKVYEGQWKDDLKQGYGVMYYQNGDVYEGKWNKGKKQGPGLYKYNSGIIFTGNFSKGKKQGRGTIQFPDGTKVQGNWNSAYLEGQGKMYHANGDYFQGNYHLSEKNGKGKYVWGQCRYQGQFRKDCLDGSGKIYYNNAEYYVGSIKNGRREGQGSYYYQNGDRFEGQWHNDQKIIGTYLFQNGDLFEGRFKQGQINHGVMIYQNGQSYQGQFKHAQRHGVGLYKNKNGVIILDGYWKQDQYIGQTLE